MGTSSGRAGRKPRGLRRRARAAWTMAAFGSALVVTLAGGCDFGAPNLEQPSPAFQCYEIQDPYLHAGAWHRANLHMHTTHSDGALLAGEMVDLYAVNGYTLLSLSDHNQYGDQDGGALPQYQVDDVLHDWNGDGVLHPEHVLGSGVEAHVRDYGEPAVAWSRDAWYRPRQLPVDLAPVVLSGAEMSFGGWHFGVVGIPSGALEPPGAGQGYIQRTRDAGGLVFLAHPAEWNPYPDRLASQLDLRVLDGIEIMNGLRLVREGAAKPASTGGAGGSADACAASLPADATRLWDALLARGYRLWGFANDDAHTWPGHPEAYPFTAFEMVQTDDATPEGFLYALRRGSFYASTGLHFAELGALGHTVVASAPGAARLRFVGWGGRILLEVEGQSGIYATTGDEGYVRVEAEGAFVPEKTWLARAWSQPFYLESSPCPGGTRGNQKF